MFGISLDIEPARKLKSVCFTSIHWDINKGCMKFDTIKEAEELMNKFSKWAWIGTTIVLVTEDD